jgi:diphthine-ammonia ligase
LNNAVLYSGGKDSTLALHKVVASGIKIDLLISILSKNTHSYMFHYPNVRYTRMQAEALGIRQVFAETEGKKEEELADLERVLRENKVRTLITGATYSKYQGDRINEMAKRLGIEHIAPLWHVDPIVELNELKEKFDVIITSVSAEGLDESLLGERIDDTMIKKLQQANRRHGINMLFEGGEAESFVLDAPLFQKRIEILKARTEWNGVSGAYFIEEARLTKKQ